MSSDLTASLAFGLCRPSRRASTDDAASPVPAPAAPLASLCYCCASCAACEIFVFIAPFMATGHWSTGIGRERECDFSCIIIASNATNLSVPAAAAFLACIIGSISQRGQLLLHAAGQPTPVCGLSRLPKRWRQTFRV